MQKRPEVQGVSAASNFLTLNKDKRTFQSSLRTEEMISCASWSEERNVLGGAESLPTTEISAENPISGEKSELDWQASSHTDLRKESAGGGYTCLSFKC